MQRYLGTKVVEGQPMTRGEYNSLRGWTNPSDENPNDAGYLVGYLGGGKPNHSDFPYYISWSPAEVFEKAYRPTQGMSFGQALDALKTGHRVARAGWNGKGMWLDMQLQDGRSYPAGELGLLPHLAWIGMKTADNKFVPWLASQTDVLSEDWTILP